MIGSRLRRLTFATILTAITFSIPEVGETQQAHKIYRIGSLVDGAATIPQYRQAFVNTLREHGFVEGQNLTLELRFAAGRVERFPEFVADLVRLNVDVIVSGATPALRAAKQATTTVPIVMVGARDPVGDGLVASLAHPGGNVTGVAGNAGPEILGKMLQVMKEAVPTVSRVAILSNAASYGTASERSSVLEAAAQKLGLTLRNFDAENRDDFDRLFSAMARERVNALLVRADPLLNANRRRIAELAVRHRLPAIYGQSSFVYDANGLMYYGSDIIALNKQAALYVSKILKGAKPADLPVEQPTKFELVINLKTAKALGLTIPRSVLFRADHVIE